MIESKGEQKFNKVDDYTIEVCDDNGCKVWTLETLDHSIIQIEKDKEARKEELEAQRKESEGIESDDDIPDERLETLEKYEEYYKNLLAEASKLGIVRQSHTRTVYHKPKK